MAEPSSTVRQRQLIAELRRLRDVSGRTIDDVAAKVGISNSSLSRIENGTIPKLPVLRSLLAEYGVDEAGRSRLEQLRREASQRGWWQLASASDPFKTLVGLEAGAAWISYFSPTVIPGLLQTADYARAVISVISFELSSEEVDERVHLRLRRQEQMGGVQQSIILGQEAFLRRIGGRQVMAEQVQRLIQAADERQIDIQLLDVAAGEHLGLMETFEIIGLQTGRPEAVYLEGARWDACVEETSELNMYSRSFDKLRAIALGPKESKARLQEIAEDLAS